MNCSVLFSFYSTSDSMLSVIISRLEGKGNSFEAAYLVASCFKLVAANLLILVWKENKELTSNSGLCFFELLLECVCVHLHVT